LPPDLTTPVQATPELFEVGIASSRSRERFELTPVLDTSITALCPLTVTVS
jgi:hypothetical protein